MPDTPITFENVEVIRDGSMGFWCRCGEREVFIGANVPLSGTTIHRVGDCGRLVVPRWFAEQHELRSN